MIIGIDIGGTNIKGVLIKNNRVIAKKRTPTGKSKKEIFAKIFNFIEKFSEKGKIDKIGIGVPGPTNFYKQRILSPANIKSLNNLYLGKIIKEKFNIKTIIDNDSNCFVLAETLLGAGKGKKMVVGLTFGTSIGGGIVINKELIRGTGGTAGEFGHMIIQTDGPKCSCGNRGCLRVYLNKNRKYLGIGLANIINILNPDVVVIGGGLSNLGEVLLKPIRKEMKKHIISPLAKNTPVVRAKLGEYAGAIGAALLRQY